MVRGAILRRAYKEVVQLSVISGRFVDNQVSIDMGIS